MAWFKMVSLIGGILGLNVNILADVALNKVCFEMSLLFISCRRKKKEKMFVAKKIDC